MKRRDGQLAEVLARSCGVLIVRDQVYVPGDLRSLIAEAGGPRMRLLTFETSGRGLEIVTVNSTTSLPQVSLVRPCRLPARRPCSRDASAFGVVTTNDNLRDLWFYQRLGFRILVVDAGAVDRARLLKPDIRPFTVDASPCVTSSTSR